jgi:hypothetical protein
MKRNYALIFIILMITLCLSNCAGLLTEEAIISGKVKLSDNPTTGHGGVIVTCGSINSITRKDGSFELQGDVMGEITLEIRFQKTLYKEKIMRVDIPYTKEDDEINIKVDVGTVVLNRETL